MCRYAFHLYKQHYACFRCRKSFKRRLLRDVDPGGEERPAVCPQCREPMADMGLDFAPPPMRDRAAWARLASLWSIGITFHSCGCGGPGYRPRDAHQHRAFLAQRREQYQASLDAATSSDARQHWAERVAAIEAAIQQG